MSISKLALTHVVLAGSVVAGSFALGGCASSPGGIEPTEVSTAKYAGQSCASLRARSRQVTTEAQRLAGKVTERSTNDAVAMGVALVVFWPAAFFVKGDGPEAEEYAKLLGERRAIEAASKRQGCNIKFVPLKGSDVKEKKPEGNPGHVIQ